VAALPTEPADPKVCAASARALSVPSSTLHRVHKLVEGLELEGRRDIIKLHVGEPGFAPPSSVSEAMARAVRQGQTGYTSAEGLPLLRERIADYQRARHGVELSPRQIIVTPGSTQALLAVMLATCDPGDELLLPEIHWPMYAQAAAVAGVRVRFYPLGAGARVEAACVAEGITPATRLVVLNSPANPTGAVAERAEVRALVKLAHERGFFLISDEAYECFVYEGIHVCAAAEEQALGYSPPRVFTVNTFSKSHAMTGLRLGYVVAPDTQLAEAIIHIQEASIVAPSTPVQWAGIAALEDTAFVQGAREQLRATRDRGFATLRDVLLPFPSAGWYALVSIASTGMSSESFAEALLETHSVSVAPGSAFVPIGAPDPGMVRVAFCGPPEAALEGLARLESMLRTSNTARARVRPAPSYAARAAWKGPVYERLR
jgi:aspartate aminotransferase